MLPKCAWIILMLGAALAAQTWEKRMEKRAEALGRKYGQGTNPALRERLIRMGAQDQAVRKRIPSNLDEVRALEETDRKLTLELQQIVERYGWPSIPLVGLAGADAAQLILIHTADHDWQRGMIPVLEKLLAEDQLMNGDPIATATDKLLRSEGKPQRYGTQFSFDNGKAFMQPVEDPERLEQRRASLQMAPLGAYRRQIEKMYKVKASRP